MLNNGNPNAKKGCKLSLTGKCKDCPHWRCMPVDVSDPTTGEVIKQGTVWDCLLAWQMLGSWDAGRQSQAIHAAMAQNTNEIVKTPKRIVFAIEEAQQRRLANAVRED